jgi:hypothetical protein
MTRIALEPFRNVPSGTNNGTTYLQTTRVYPNTLESLIVQLGNAAGTTPTKSELSRIVVKLGSSSKPIWDVSGDQINSMNLYDGRPNTATVLVLPFSNPRARTIESQMIGALDTGQVGVREMTVEVTMTRATYNNATLTAWAEVAPPKLFGQGAPQNSLFRAILLTPLTFTGALTRFPQTIASAAQGGALLRRIYFFSALVTSYELRRDGQPYFEDTPLAVNNAYLDELGHDPQANIYTYDAIDDDNESKSLPQVRVDKGGLSLIPMQHLVTVSGGGTVNTLADVHANVNGL